MNTNEIIKDLCLYRNEKEWFEFADKLDGYDNLGACISAVSNAALYAGKKNAYIVWGIDNNNRKIVGTEFDFNINANQEESLEAYLERRLSKNVKIEFAETKFKEKRVVVLSVSVAESALVEWDGRKFIKIDSSIGKLEEHHDRELFLSRVLKEGYPSIVNTPSKYQNLTFAKLFGYYGANGILLKEETFKNDLCLLTEDGRYNIQAQLLSDDSHISLKVSAFGGKTKSARVLLSREFGNNCLLFTLDEVLRYGDVLNIIQADERNRIVERLDVPLFDGKVFNEAMINAVLHDKWIEGDGPELNVFTDRIEILSRGGLAPDQTMSGFFSGKSVPVNKKLSKIFHELHVNEESGGGVPKIVKAYGRKAICINDDSVVVKIPFHWINAIGQGDTEKPNSKITPNRRRILAEIQKNPKTTAARLSAILMISVTAVQKNIRYLKDIGFIERIGCNKTGHWMVKYGSKY